jgi:hypothetical protein
MVVEGCEVKGCYVTIVVERSRQQALGEHIQKCLLKRWFISILMSIRKQKKL